MLLFWFIVGGTCFSIALHFIVRDAVAAGVQKAIRTELEDYSSTRQALCRTIAAALAAKDVEEYDIFK